MADLVFKNTPWGDVVVKDSWPPWQRKAWLEILGVPQDPSWVPTYEGPFTVTSPDGQIELLSQFNFATEETALEIVRRFKADRVAILPFEGTGGGNVGPNVVRWVVWADGIAIKAGLLAEHFTENDEDLYPNVAVNACTHDIDAARTSGQKLPAA